MKKTLKISLIIFNILLILGLVLVVGFILYLLILNTTLKFNKNKILLSNMKLEIYGESNEVINQNSNLKIDLNELNDYTVSAFLSIEDKDFYTHHGINYKRIVAATLTNLKTRSLSQGASTISQQLIKNTHLTNEKTFARKIKEIILTKQMEKQVSKDKILETYLNVIYFGENSFGIEQASNVFFSKSAKDLSIGESATLAGIIKSPAKFSPIYNQENCLERRNLVLKEMKDDFRISEEEYIDSVNQDLNLNINPSAKTTYKNLYLKQTYDEAIKILNITEKEIGLNGIKIYTYQDIDKQKELNDLINSDNYYLENSYGNTADSLACLIDNSTGGIVAYAGKSDYNLTNLKRQPGSAIKPPLVYSPALEYGYISPITPIYDEEINFNGYSPHNLGNVYHGYVSASDCVAKSLNIPAVKLMNYVGIDKCKNFAKKSNIEFDKNDNGYAIALGGFTNGIRLIDLTNSYLPYANSGKIMDSKFIKKIENSFGKILYENNIVEKEAMNDDTAYLMHTMLVDGVKNGTSKALSNLTYEVAGKTGTVAIKNSNNNSDAISVAYTSSHTMGVWFGNTSNAQEYELSSKNNGGTYATYVIRDMFDNIYQNEIPTKIIQPDSVIQVDIDVNELTNNNIVKIACESCPDRYKIKTLVSKRHLPETAKDEYSNIEIDGINVNYNSGITSIKFDAKNYVEYNIYRICNGKKSLIKTIQNEKGEIEVLDESLGLDSTYKYFIEAKYSILNSTYTSKEYTIVTPKYEEKYLNIIKEENDKINNNKEDKNWFFNFSK